MLIYIVFVFPYVRSYVRSCVRYISLFLLSSVTLVEFTTKFWLKFLQWCMSHLSLIRKHSIWTKVTLEGWLSHHARPTLKYDKVLFKVSHVVYI